MEKLLLSLVFIKKQNKTETKTDICDLNTWVKKGLAAGGNLIQNSFQGIWCKPKPQVFITIWHCDTTADLKSKQIRVLHNVVASHWDAEGPPFNVSSSPPQHEFQGSLWSPGLLLAVTLGLAGLFCWICLSLYLSRSPVNFHSCVANWELVCPFLWLPSCFIPCRLLAVWYLIGQTCFSILAGPLMEFHSLPQELRPPGNMVEVVWALSGRGPKISSLLLSEAPFHVLSNEHSD